MISKINNSSVFFCLLSNISTLLLFFSVLVHWFYKMKQPETIIVYATAHVRLPSSNTVTMKDKKKYAEQMKCRAWAPQQWLPIHGYKQQINDGQGQAKAVRIFRGQCVNTMARDIPKNLTYIMCKHANAVTAKCKRWSTLNGLLCFPKIVPKERLTFLSIWILFLWNPLSYAYFFLICLLLFMKQEVMDFFLFVLRNSLFDWF